MNEMIRPRRLRGNERLRRMVRETRVSIDSLVWPLFLREGKNIREEIPSLPGQIRYSPDQAAEAAERALRSGVRALLLFGIPNEKDERGSQAYAKNGVVQQGIRALKERYPELFLITDVCMCEYTSHGHCGILNGRRVDNDKTLPYLAATALSHATAGADMVAPSDMMDGRVAAIRSVLDENGYTDTPILSYAVKYSSAFYGPFRDAAGSAPSFGNRKSYQMDFHNSREAIKEALLDVEEGADLLMVKPAMSYLDVISRVKAETNLPLAAYSVSGEYAMLKAAGAQGLLDEYAAMCESAAGIYRAGADVLITYYARELAEAIKKGDLG